MSEITLTNDQYACDTLENLMHGVYCGPFFQSVEAVKNL
jgi:hypothetical protein